MTALPKRKPSTQRQGKRRAALKKQPQLPHLVVCSNCGNMKRPHQVCSACGYYNGKEVIGQE